MVARRATAAGVQAAIEAAGGRRRAAGGRGIDAAGPAAGRDAGADPAAGRGPRLLTSPLLVEAPRLLASLLSTNFGGCFVG